MTTVRTVFDELAGDYAAELNRGLSLTGETTEFFAEHRVRWLAERFHSLDFRPSRILDYGSGTGGSLPFLFQHLGADSVTAVDISREALAVAQKLHAHLPVRFRLVEDFQPVGDMDLVFCNGVFHHVRAEDRASCLRTVHASLKRGGYLAFWENNPWNPMTRLLMRRVTFDRDAVLIWPREARRLLRTVGFQVQTTDFLFVFPSFLSALRPVEPLLTRLPLGGQYLVLGRKVS